MKRGTMYLDYEGEPQFKIDVTRFILRENEVAFDFSGSDEGSRYSGSCQLRRSDDAFEGDARYRYAGESNEQGARIALILHLDCDEISATGVWTDEGDVEPYGLYAELYEGSS